MLGPEHPSTLNTANNLAQSLATQGKYADAERIQSEVHGVCKRVLGPEHPDTLSAADNLALSLFLQRKYVEAVELFQVVLAGRQRVLEADHPSTLRTMRALENARGHVRAGLQKVKAGKPEARRNVPMTAAPASPTALAEAEARSRTAEAELLAMLELEEAGAKPAGPRGKGKPKASGRRG